jgi:ubiquinone/menaquinone biosynthesis C-methylase UbiE
MKENKYDDSVFFKKYGEMARSRLGLAGAGEWQAFSKLMPDFSGKKVLDLGCGYGWHCIYAWEQGADEVVGTDISENMLEVAREKTKSFSGVSLIKSAMEDLNFCDGEFDVVLSSLAFHYVRDFEDMVRKIYRWLSVGGYFVFSVEHPVFTAYGSQDWYYDESGNILHFPVDNYYYEGERDAVFLGEHVIKYHRTLTTYINSLISAGFTVENVTEPEPPENMMDIPGMKDEMRRPMMLLIRCRK